MQTSIRTDVVLDTGGAYFICPPKLAKELDLDFSAYSDEEIHIRGNRVNGKLCRLPLTFIAAEGRNLEIEVAVFIPDPDLYEAWSLPPYIGWMGCLENIRFAIDPSEDAFYFGPRPT